MSSTGATQLQYSEPIGAAVHWVEHNHKVDMNPATNMFAPKKWSVNMNEVSEYIDYTLSNNSVGNYNGTAIYFNLDKQSTYMGRMELHYLRSAISNYSGTYARFHDWEGYSSLEKYTISYLNNTIVYSITGDQLQTQAFTEKNDEWRTREAKMQHGNATEYERNVWGTGAEATATGVWCVMDLQIPFAKSRKMIPVIALPEQVRIGFHFKPLINCIQSDGNGIPTCTITELKLRVFVDHIPMDCQTLLWKQVKEIGYALKIKTIESEPIFTQTATDPTISQTWTICLRNLKNYSFMIMAMIRPSTTTAPSALSNTLDLHNYIVPSRWWLEDGNTAVTTVFEGLSSTTNPSASQNQWGLVTNNSLAYPDMPNGTRFIMIPFTHNDWNFSSTLDSEDNCWGGRFLQRYSNLRLKMVFDANHPQLVNGTQYQVNVDSYIHNAAFFVGGDFRRFLL